MRLKVVLTKGRRATEVGFGSSSLRWIQGPSDLPVTVVVPLESVLQEFKFSMKTFVITQGSSLMMEAVCTSETSVDNHFTRQYNPDDSFEHHTRRRENLKSHIMTLLISH
jgi:hypothetical protein